jgi:hypothetical protein
MAVEAAMAFVGVVRSGELSRLRICEYPDYGNLVVDLSKNGPGASARPAAEIGRPSPPTGPARPRLGPDPDSREASVLGASWR